MSKLLVRWGLRPGIEEAAVQSRKITMTHCESNYYLYFCYVYLPIPTDEHGEILGEHQWYEELFEDAGGDFVYMHVSEHLNQLFI